MHVSELLEYRMNQTENVLKCMEANIEQMHKNFESHLNLTQQLSERMKVLENELQERRLKKYVYNLLMYTYPIIISILIFIMNADHQKIADATMDFDNIAAIIAEKE